MSRNGLIVGCWILVGCGCKVSAGFCLTRGAIEGLALADTPELRADRKAVAIYKDFGASRTGLSVQFFNPL
jgi:hypothetical protein